MPPFAAVLLLSSLILTLCLFTITGHTHPAPSGSSVTCHGPLPGVQYRYAYRTDLRLNNADAREPAGFTLEATFSLHNVWQNREAYLAEIHLDRVQFKPRVDARAAKFEAGPVVDSWPVVLAHVEGKSGRVRSLYVAKDKAGHSSGHRLEPTQLNLVVALLNALRSRFGDELPSGTTLNGRQLIRHSDATNLTTSTTSLLAPLIEDHWTITSTLASDHDIPEHVTGWQNVSIESKIFRSAHSQLTSTFELQLENEKATGRRFEGDSVQQALKNYPEEMVPLSVHFIAEKKPCDPHYCGSLADLVADYSTLLAEDNSLAKTSIGVAYLRLLEYFRVNSGTVTKKDVAKLLKKYFKTRHTDGNVFITLLDAVAGSRHHEAMLAAVNFLDLAQCGEASADICERFLVAVSISAITTANMGASYIAEHSLSSEQLVDLFLPLSTSPKWADDRVKHAYGLTLATLVHAYQVAVANEAKLGPNGGRLYTEALVTAHSSPVFVDVTEEDASGRKLHAEKLGGEVKHAHRVATVAEKALKYLIHQLDACKDADCRVVHLHAIGNARVLAKHGVLHVLKKYALLSSGKRESVAALKALRDCIEYSVVSGSADLSEKMLTRLRQLLLRVVYDSSLETTSRLIAAELLAKYVDVNGRITYELVQHLDSFPAELATMIWKRAVVNVRARHPPTEETTARTGDWQLHSKALSGSSASFKYVMGGTAHCNASYGVFLELLKGKLPKETSFNVELSSGEVVQDVINVGLFARGLQSFAGGEDTGDGAAENEVPTTEDEEDSTLAGMTLQLLGNQLRPFLFFRSTSELMGHLWSGAASEPTPVFRANLLMADYADIRPLINGLLVEQSLKGILSLDLTGEVQVSLWNRNSHSNVITMASALFQGSQQIFTTDRQTSARKLFSFGAESKLNFITDFDFYNSPYRICIQITQPEFVFRHNTRKYEQVHSDSLHRRVHRRSYRIPAKSYVLNRDNSEMCALMNADSE